MVARKRTVPRRQALDLNVTLDEYLTNRAQRERGEYHEGRLKKEMMDELAESGELDGGHRYLYVDTPLVFHSYKGGKPVAKTITGVQRKRAVSQPLNEERTMALLKEKGLLDECTEVVVVLNEDALLAANFRGKISDEEMAKLYDEEERFSFWLVEGEAEE